MNESPARPANYPSTTTTMSDPQTGHDPSPQVTSSSTTWNHDLGYTRETTTVRIETLTTIPYRFQEVTSTNVRVVITKVSKSVLSIDGMPPLVQITTATGDVHLTSPGTTLANEQREDDDTGD